jgi:GntR family transcriptional repressor for pyruvate dehydrogenase complex
MLRAGEFSAGQRLPSEAELSQIFGVSRGTLRSATQELQRLGLLEVRQGDGTVVRSPDHDVFFPPFRMLLTSEPHLAAELLQFRRLLEPEVARLAAARCVSANGKQLYSLVERQRTAADQGIHLTKEDLIFHHQIATIANNTLVLKILNVLQGLLEEFRFQGSLQETIRQHQSIADAIANNCEEDAQQAMIYHLDWVIEVAKSQGLKDS